MRLKVIFSEFNIKVSGNSMKKILKLLFVLAMFSICFLLKNVVMWEAMYNNNYSLSLKENREIKRVILESIKDLNISYYNADKDKLYQEKMPGSVIQFGDDPSENNYLFCSVPIYFMKSMEIYQDIYYFYFPVDYYGGTYYCIEVKKFGDSYKVISFGFD